VASEETAPAVGDSCIAFRTRAAVLRGGVDLVLGLAVVTTAVVFGPRNGASAAGIAVFGFLVALVAAGRMSARVEVRADRVRWSWAFAHHEVAYDDVVDVRLAGAGPGFRSLVLVRRHGPPVCIEPVGAFALNAAASPATADQQLIEWAVDQHRTQAHPALSSV